MVATAERYNASLVGGPQYPIFEKPGSEKWARHPVFLPHYSKTGPVPIIYSSGNLLIARPVLEAIGYPFMDLKFNFTGGGDSDFINRSRAKGFTIAWCNEGIVRETIPARRLESDWITARGLRNGVLSTLIEQRQRKDEPLGQVRVFEKSRSFGLFSDQGPAARHRGALRAGRDLLHPYRAGPRHGPFWISE